MFLSKRIKEKRIEAGLTQEALGKELNVSKVSVCNWETRLALSNEDKLARDYLIQLSKVLNTPLEYLIGNDTYVVSEDDEKYGLMLATEEINIIKELRNHKKLYDMLMDNPKRTFDRIDKNLF